MSSPQQNQIALSNLNNSVKHFKRPSWDQYFKEIVMVTATRSSCDRLNVGCILVNNRRIIAQGYNGFLPGCPHTSKVRGGHEQATIHAEQNAITDCANRGVSTKGATAYITHYPCINCMKLLCAAGISNIKFIEDYKNDELVKYFSQVAGVPIEKLL
jgi:dCMP deaminase